MPRSDAERRRAPNGKRAAASAAPSGGGWRGRLPFQRPPGLVNPLVPWWLPPLFVALGLLLAPWVVWLLISLPSRQVATHWEIAWGGFDLALSALLTGTGVALVRRSPSAGVLAAMTAAFLLCDAWFDTITARGGVALALALAEAALIEVPLALVCLWIARNVERVFADARPFLIRAGFRIEDRRLVPPADEPAIRAGTP